MSRVYVPATVDHLAEWHALGAVPVVAEAVLVHEDDEELEYDALMTAAAAAADLLDRPGRRVVIVAETASGEPSQVAWSQVVAVHADAAERAPEEDPDEDLAWFATQEVPHLLGQG